MYFVKTPGILRFLFKKIIWRIPDSNKIYLSFDDGPNPESTPQLLDLLNRLEIKASFFCQGNKAEKYKSLVDQIKANGHSIGGHGYTHLSGWNTSVDTYINNVHKAQNFLNSKLFRPPYGKLKLFQFLSLVKDYKIVMWDIMPGDFEDDIQPLQLYNRIKKHAVSGSIIVLHDNITSINKLSELLPMLREEYTSFGIIK